MDKLINSVKDWFNGLDATMQIVCYACLGVVVLLLLFLCIGLPIIKSKKRKAKKQAETTAYKPKEKKEEKPAEVKPVEEKTVEKEPQKKTEQPKPVAKKTVKPTAKKEETVKAEVKAEKPTPKKAEHKETAPVKAEKKPTASATTKTAKQPKKTESSKPSGKWTVEIKSADEFMAKLYASNGEEMLTSEIYTTEDGARNGIATLVKNITETGDFLIYEDKRKNYYYKLKNKNNRLLCVGEIYKTKDQCLKAVESVKRIAQNATIEQELVKGDEYAPYKPDVLDKKAIKTVGKWKIELTDDKKYSAKLYANNGQLMLATEGVASRDTAVDAIESVKKNSFDGNFIIDRDKFGRFYYKLRNAKKSVLCIGESYDTVDGCKNAIESVRRNAFVSELSEDLKDQPKSDEKAAKTAPKTATKSTANKTQKTAVKSTSKAKK
ncbi:MAG: DUF1508 domain-containing protein [Clostridia bacterium]|nr:DUF1508 domain-containing protein [Clostridia bacterium]